MKMNIVLDPIRAFGDLIIYRRRPNPKGVSRYVVGHTDGRLLEDFRTKGDAVRWAQSQSESFRKLKRFDDIQQLARQCLEMKYRHRWRVNSDEHDPFVDLALLINWRP